MLQTVPSGGAGLGAAFSCGSRAVVYSSINNGCPQAPVENRSATGGQREPAVHEIALLSNRFDSVTCQLISECHSIFCALQDIGASASSSSRSGSLLHTSRQYRAVLHACLLNAGQRGNSSGDGLPSAAGQPCHGGDDMVDVFASMELIWHLCEIVFLEVLPVGCVMQPLLEWIRWHCGHVDERVHQLLGQVDPTTHGEFWNTMNLLVLHGRVDVARDLLARVPSRRSSFAYNSLDELLRKMPVPQALFGQSLGEFSLRWSRWQQECRDRCAQGEFSDVPQLQHIVQMLYGDSAALQACQPLCENWYELMVGTLLYTNPTIKAVDLQYRLPSFLDGSFAPGTSSVGVLDTILKSVFVYDISLVIRQCSEEFSPLNYWFSAHLTDLMHHCGKLESRSVDYGLDQREFLLLELASSLMSHKSFWQTGVSYLDHCPAMGRAYLEQLIQRIPLESEAKAMKVLSVCEKREMTEAAHSVCHVMAMQALRNNRLGSALNWCLKSKDSTFAAYLADRLLSRYSADGVFEHLDLIENLGPAMLLNNRLTFLAQYQQFHRLYNNQDFKEAGNLVFSLLDSRLAPKELWPTILMDCLPLLELDEVVFSSDQTYELMYCLEEVENNGCKSAEATNGHGSQDATMDAELYRHKQMPIDQLMDKLALLRLALARNLARAIISVNHS